MDVLGVDFSGAARAGAKLWVAETTVDDAGDGPTVRRCASMADRVGTTDRDPCLDALIDCLSGADVAGIDVSFGLPRAVHDCDDWRSFLEWFPGGAGDADAFQAQCRERARTSAATGVDLKRVTDERPRANSPYGLITYKQTFHGIRDVLATLADRVATPPMDDPADVGTDGKPVLCEVYPAGTLRALGLPDERYKDDTDAATRRRATIVDGLREHGLAVREGIAERARADPSGDPLDALIAAFAVDRARRRGFDPRREYDPVEGHIYL